MTIKERILYFAENQGISKVKIYEIMGIAASNFKGAGLKSDLSSEKTARFLTAFPNISAEWLLTGKGDMLMPTPQTTNVNVDMGDSIHHNSASVIARGAQATSVSTDEKDRIIAEQQTEIKALKEQVSDLTKSILNITKQIK